MKTVGASGFPKGNFGKAKFTDLAARRNPAVCKFSTTISD